jgi:eukaryotic-like serine/threonine-protein kinase
MASETRLVRYTTSNSSGMNGSNTHEDQEAPRTVRPGEVLGGRFEIVRRIGAGGMGEVFEASDCELGVTVALKTIRDDRLANASVAALERFRDEVKLARQVTHPNVCRIFDVGRDGNRLYLTMELVQGGTLSGLLRQGRMSVEEALPLACQIAAGLDALHAQGLVHRDLKPSNVLIAEGSGNERRAVITDFGLVRPEEATMTVDTAGSPHVSGTPDYMAPEQLLGKTVTAASDLYAFGLILYEMVTGVRAFAGGRALENAIQRLAQQPSPPSSHASDLPARWNATILQCLDPDPTARPASAGAVAAALTGTTAGARPARHWPVLLAAAAVILALAVVPWTRLTRREAAAAPSAGGAHETYGKAQDALDHYYRPHALENAIDLLNRTVEQDPNFALAYAGLARANFLQYWQMRDTKYVEPARANAEKALGLDAKLASVHVTLGRLYTETGKKDLAGQELNKALKLDERNGEAFYAFAMLYDTEGRTADAIENFQKAMDFAPDDWRFPDNFADFYLRSGNFERALELSLHAVQLTPDNPRALNNLGRIYRRMGRLDEARATFEKAIQIEPSYTRYLNLGVVLDDTGHPDEAAAAYRQALELNPNNFLTWGNLGFVLKELPGHETEAKAAFEKGIDAAELLRTKRPNDADLLSSLGRYYASIGNAEKSLPLLRQAAALEPKNPQILFVAASGNELLHRRTDALALLEKALAAGLARSAVDHERSLAGLRSDPEFRKLVTLYAKKP